MNCKICEMPCNKSFGGRMLLKYDISYFRCPRCGFMQTEEPHWLGEAYGSAITSLDLGYATRNLLCRDIVSTVINKGFDSGGRFLDYGGGYGLFVRLMRDVGFDYYRQDEYCENLFAKEFDVGDIGDIGDGSRFELLTAFEIFEHLANPLETIGRMLVHADSIFFSTSLQPKPGSLNSVDDWDYFAPETGQHIVFYTLEALQGIARIFNLYLYSDNSTFHLLTRKKLKANFVKRIVSRQHFLDKKVFGRYFCNKKSLLMKDVELVKKKLHAAKGIAVSHN